MKRERVKDRRTFNRNKSLLFFLYLGCRALLGLGLYVSKALAAEPADLDRPDDTAEQIKKGNYTKTKVK